MLIVATRSRQTTGSAAERRATPQYRNSAAYQTLAPAVYPWSLPFDLSDARANVFLAHLGVSRRELIEALGRCRSRSTRLRQSSCSLAAEGLGLTDAERRILVGEPLNPPRSRRIHSGIRRPLQTSTRSSALLDRSGLGFADLEALLATRFVNPGGAVDHRAAAGSRRLLRHGEAPGRTA